MRFIILALSCLVIFTAVAQSYTEPEEMKGFMDETEKAMNLEKTIEQIEKGEINSRKLQIIYLILQNTPEYYIHNLNGAAGNEVYVHVDGHRESVYGPDGKLVQDGINDGSYNYYDRKKEPLKHFFFDTHPWIAMGSSEKDTTSQRERIFGFVSDFETGLSAAMDSKDSLCNIKKDNWDRLGQIQALAIIYLALEKTNPDSLYSLFEKDTSKININDITQSLRALEAGLNMVYLSEKEDDGKPVKTSAEFQKDADIVRLKHLKYYGELIDKYYSAKKKFPLQGKDSKPIYVYIANDRQKEATKDGPNSPHTVIPLAEFIAEIESALGHKIEEYYDPQYSGDYKPNFYMYKIHQDIFFFAIHVHQPFPFAKKVSKFYYKVEISNYPTFRNQANDPQTLFNSPEFKKELNKKIEKENFFKERKEKYINYTKQKPTETFQIRGTVVYKNLEGGFFAIHGDDGSKYDAINLPESFRKDGLKVKVTAQLKKDAVSFHMYGKIIEIVDIASQ